MAGRPWAQWRRVGHADELPDVRRDWGAAGRRFDEIVRATPALRLRDLAARLGVDMALLRERCPNRVAALTSRGAASHGFSEDGESCCEIGG